MKKLIKSLIAGVTLLAGAQSVSAACDGTIYFKAPKEWSGAYIFYQGYFQEVSIGSSGWYEIATSNIRYWNMDSPAYRNFEITSVPDFIGGQWVNKSSFVASRQDSYERFTCADFGGGDDLYIYENPTEPGKTVVSSTPPNAKYLYVMIPPDKDDWMSSVPMISMDGGKTGKPMISDPEKCGWYYYVWFNEEITDDVVFYRDDDLDRSDMIGLFGNSEDEPTIIPLNTFYESYGINTLYFVPDVEQWLDPADEGWYTEYPEGVEGTCEYTMAAIIYDTDASLHPAFSCYSLGSGLRYGDGCQVGAQGVGKSTALSAIYDCIGVTPGLVEPFLDPTVPQSKRKPKMSKEGAKCFIDEKFFNQLFNYTKGVNEKSCYDMPFHRSSDGKWEFDSDYYMSPGTQATGFYPAEQTDDAVILAADPLQTPVKEARTKRDAEGPIFYGPALRELDSIEGAPRIDVLCNGPGWGGGHDCSGNFADGDYTTTFIQSALGLKGSSDCVIGWSCPDKAPAGWTFYKSGTEVPVAGGYGSNGYPRWEGLRNQHYCFESHSKFIYKPGLRFSFRGDDDIWVYVDNKLAVDLGGTHLAAPGYVNLDKFEGFSGKLIVGNEYDLDIFFCDRRTTMSNVRIKTNMYIRQKVDISLQKVKKGDEIGYEMCYTKSSDGSCASAMTGGDDGITACGAEIAQKLGVVTQYYLARGTDFDVETAKLLTNGKVNRGGIDLTDPTSPKIKAEDLDLPFGRWTLFVEMDGKHKKITTFHVIGDDEEDPDVENPDIEDPDDDISSSSSKGSSDSKDDNGESGDNGSDDGSKKSSSSGAKDPASSSSNKDIYVDDEGNEVEYAEPSFRVKMVGAFQFAIVFDTKPTKASKYAVMDQMGRIVKTGVTSSSETRVEMERAGQYIVKVGRRHQQVEFH